MRSFWYRLPLPLKFALPTALLCLLCTLTVLGASQWMQARVMQARLDGLGRALTVRLATSAAPPLVDNDPVRMQAVVAEFAGDPEVERAAVYDLRQHLIGAAGRERPDSREYTATVHWQDSAVGRAVLSLKADGSRSERRQHDMHLRDMVALAVILAVLGGAAGAWLGGRFDELLLVLTRRFSGETLAFDYPDTDTLGHLLHHPVPPLLPPEPTLPPRDGATLLQVYCPSEIAVDCARAQRQTEAVARLYGGAVSVTRAGGMTVRFNAGDEIEGPFQALCCAQLLRRLSEPHALRLALAPLAAADDGNPWREQAVLRSLNQACVHVAHDGDIALDTQLQRHPAIGERCELEPREEFWMVKALRAPYDTLLERQYATLKAQLETTSASGDSTDNSDSRQGD